MARSQSPNSANSQFFIMFEPAPHLNGQYTVVGPGDRGHGTHRCHQAWQWRRRDGEAIPDKILKFQVAADAA